MEKRNLYLKNTPVDQALSIYMEEVRARTAPSYETIPVTEALNRITRNAVFARFSSPHYNAAAMDGIAVKASDTAGASELTPLLLTPDKYQVVNTGNPVTGSLDAVIMAEDIEVVEASAELQESEANQTSDHRNPVPPESGGECIRIRSAAVPWQHIRPIGEDIVAGEMILPGGHCIRPIDIGVLLEAGIVEVEVVKRPSAAIFPTGSEIVEPGSGARPGEIIESNSRMFENLVINEGGLPTRFNTLKDDPDVIRKAVSEAADKFDLVIINAGTSAGTRDYTVHVLRELGEVLVHGVAVKPGKPVILAFIGNTPVIGLPGYPVSAYIDFTTFVSPVLEYLGSRNTAELTKAEAVISRRIVSSLKYQEYVRIKAGIVDGRLVAAPLARGAGAAMSLVRSDGFCVIPQESEGLEAGETAEVTLYRPMSEIAGTAVLIGSHDLILDVIADIMSDKYRNLHLSSTHVGSMGGLMSLRRGEAHVAPTHLLDEETGVYNVKYLQNLFPGEKMALIKGVDRIQGLMVPKGNPLNIQGVADIVNKRYVNRQRGAGTRVLLDYKLAQLGIDPETIDGYDREAGTHMAVAAAVSSGSADTGMGVLSAARAMDLDFVEVGPEEYDFAIPVRYLDLPFIKAFIEILKSDDFHRRLEELGGYGWSHCGEIIEI